MDEIPGAPGEGHVPAPPAGSIPPAPGTPTSPAATAPTPPTPPTRRSRAGLIAVIVVAVVVVGGIAAALAGGGDDPEAASPAASPSGTPAPSPASPTSDPSTTAPPAGTVPDEIGGAPRITGATGAAFEELMRGFAKQDSLAVGVYGTMQAPRFMYIVLGTADDMEGLPLDAFLNLMAAGGDMTIQGDIETRSEGEVDAACGSTDDLSLAYMCVTIDDGSVDALFGFEDTPTDEQLALAIAAA